MSYQRVEVTYADVVPPSNATKASVEDYADLVRQTLRMGIRDDLVQVVQKLGGRMHFVDLDEWAEESGSIFVHKQNDFDIVLPQYTSPLRDRFTIGHELGHYFLHAKQGEIPLIAMRKGTGRAEWEANWFAAALLMPRTEFASAWKHHNGDVDRVAAIFGVSRDAAKIRGEQIGN